MRNHVAALLLFLSWPVCLIHRIWNAEPERKISAILLDTTVSQDFRWYWVYNELWLSAGLVIAAFIIHTRKTRTIRILLRCVAWIAIIDIVHYWLWFRRSEVVLTIEGIIMCIGAILIFKPCIKIRR